MVLTAADVVTPVARYAQRLHALAGQRHHVASPLGAWLLLALCATASQGEDTQILNAALGCDVPDAAALASQLLASPHPLVGAAAGAWNLPGGGTPATAKWLEGLPPQVQTGPMPGQPVLDDWARRYSFGLIERFPVRLDPSLQLLAASLLATRVSWERPFDLAPAASLGPGSPWAGSLSRVLRTPEAPGHGLPSGHEQFIATTSEAGDVAVHTARAAGGLAVTSVAAAPQVPPAQVLAAAYGLASALATEGGHSGAGVARRSLFDLPLGDQPLWSISERTAQVVGGDRDERCAAVLPAWSARTELDLTDPGLGFSAAMRSLVPGPWQARQAATARYSRTGFEAAAASAVAGALAMRVPREGLVRTAELRFAHPFAAVAVTEGQGHWHGLPVFSAWVTDPQDAEP
jgi:hypothetical protein